jgi:UDP-hydrolysing UDP-N-acetyl-D-glucosamine 2-epimerase
MKRRVVVITGTRADYGLLHPLLVALEAADELDVGLVVTGTHLDDRFGMTVDEIEADGHTILARVPLPLRKDTGVGVAHATGAAVSGVADALAAADPSIVVALGDRYETLAAAVAATLMRIPVAHLHGGEVTEGAVDDALRHAITKLSAVHFVATADAERRVLQMGEDPARVFNVGALGVDNALRTQLIPSVELGRQLGFDLASPSAVVTFHPVTLDENAGVAQVEELLAALDLIPALRVALTRPNADAGNSIILERLESWAAGAKGRARSFVSLGRVRYLSAVAAADVVVGNSSSGIIEAPSLGTPSVDVGDRQAGRARAATVLHAKPERDAIGAAIQRALAPEMQRQAALRVNPYGDGHAAERITDVLLRLGELSTRKRFLDQ